MVAVLSGEPTQVGKTVSEGNFSDVANRKVLTELGVDHLELKLTDIGGGRHVQLLFQQVIERLAAYTAVAGDAIDREVSADMLDYIVANLLNL